MENEKLQHKPQYDKNKNYANIIRLNHIMLEKGYTIPKLAKASDIAVSTLRSKMSGQGHFGIVEQTRLSMVLEIAQQERYEIFVLPYEQLFDYIYNK